MLTLLAVILAVAWLAGITIFHVTSAGLHLLLIIAVACLFVQVFRTSRASGHH
jgi:hypothetical protein